ncbi:MAG: LPS-assembly protein LptD [Candidatus Aminicenantes bacterium]|nr:LPS-assembly protein LptD [Candidatus Aminicenantes bacterium]
MNCRRVPILLLLLLSCLRSVSFGQEELALSELTVIANHKERLEGRLLASGDVEIHYKDFKLFADRVEVDVETKDVFAEGNVVVQFPDEVISVDSIRFNLDSKQGTFQNVYGIVQPTVLYEAESVERSSDEVYSLKRAKFTTCTQPTPRWLFTASKANLKKGDYMEMWNSVVRIKNIPVFYFPYIRYPLGQAKSTGFLTPNLGYNGQKGFHLSESFYWNMRRNMDSTLSLDYYGAKGLGGGLEYRYLFSDETGGVLSLYYFKFKDDPELELPDNAYLIRFNHNQPLPHDFKLVADVDYQSSYEFLREFDNNFKRAVVSNRRSQVFLSRSWSYFNLNMRVSRFETHYTDRDNAIVRNNLPEIGFSSSKIKLFSPLYFSFASNFSAWEYGWTYAKREGVTYAENFEEGSQRYSQSLSFVPTLSLPFTSIPWLSVNSSLSTNLAYDFQSYAPNTKTIVSEPLLRQNISFNMDFIGPVFNKVFYNAENEPKLKHVIEPIFSYRYESPVEQSERVITSSRFFTRDHYVKYGLTNRIIIKQEDMPRELLTLGLSQIYYLDPEDSPLQAYEVDGEIPSFADIDGYLRFYPSNRYSVDFSMGLNPYHKTFTRLRLGANFGYPTDALFLRVSWFKSLNPYFDNTFGKRHQISFYAGTKIPRLNLEAIGAIDYNIQERKLLYSALSLVYHYQCLDFKADVRIFYFREKPEIQFGFSFGLGNIGSTEDLFGGLDF